MPMYKIILREELDATSKVRLRLKSSRSIQDLKEAIQRTFDERRKDIKPYGG